MVVFFSVVIWENKKSRKFETVSVPDRTYNDCRYYMDSTKIREELGWSEQIPFTDGLKATVSWYVQNMGLKMERERILVFGAAGWIGGQFCRLLQEQGIDFLASKSRVGEDSDKMVEEEVLAAAPSHIVSFIGRAYGPGNNTIDYLEERLVINLRDNLFATVLLADICQKLKIHFTYIGSGCIFNYIEDQPTTLPSHTEDDVPNFFGSSYSIVKGYTDRLMHHYENTLNVRVCFPISDEVHPRNIVTKLACYPKIYSMPNSVTVLPELLPVLLDLVRKQHVGTINLVNHGTIDHEQILTEYIKHVDPSHKYELIISDDSDELLSKLKKKRCNCFLDTKVLEAYPQVSSAKEAVSAAVQTMAKKGLN